MKPYYYVFKPVGHPPSRKHDTLEDAIKESRRLCEIHPNQTFEVLQCVAITSAPKPQVSTFYMDGVMPEKHHERFPHEGFPDDVPLPAITHEFSKVIYRGYAWFPDYKANYAILTDYNPDAWEYLGHDRPLGNPDSRYCEFIK
jgi:hypothetical protein